MAVEASHISLFPPPNREEVIYQGKLLEVYGSGRTDSFLAPDFKAESGLASGASFSRKRLRDSSSFYPSLPNAPIVNVHDVGQVFGEFAFLGEDVSSQIYQQQLEIDCLIAHHIENARAEIEEMRKQNSRRLIATLYDSMMNRLKTKEEEILKIGQLNWSLEEKVRSLSLENQILKELVQTNEATANALRNKLQQVLAHIQLQQQDHYHHLNLADNSAAKATVVVDDAGSQCGSNYEEDHERQVVEDGGGERKVIDVNGINHDACCNSSSRSSRYGGMRSRWWCRRCGKEESCVLLLPCRHLCVCSLCVSSVSLCPVCNTTKSAGVHVNMNPF
ncbi:hypothetical protein SSX86_005989 [Deinandra increscens subsp. villosa]|uniref:RING-type domain-containing protein n=1 Tax=Deinandra increscens subsp. villosa TaxID=3103831 RepID=A0AAP0HAK3_9ASTR